MMQSQLGRTLLSGSSSSPDAQEVRSDEREGYGDLMDAIDRLLARSEHERDG